jgi:hypothetical protein
LVSVSSEPFRHEANQGSSMFKVTERPIDSVVGRFSDRLLPERGTWPKPGVEHLRAIWARGWPFMALHCVRSLPVETDPQSDPELIDESWLCRVPGLRGGVQARYYAPLRWLQNRDYAIVPYFPLWLGFTADTIFFGTLWWALLRGPFVLRRHLRLRRHHCPACNYNLAGLPPGAACPECGKPSEKR